MTGNGKAVLLVGGAKGIGLATLHALAADAYSVIVWDSQAHEPGEGAPAAERKVIDITDRSEVSRAIETLRQAAVRLHAAVVTAGIHATSPAELMSDDTLDRVMEVNFSAHAKLVRDLIPLMLPEGRIIGVSSIAATVGIPMSSAYSASKAALELFYESLALELRRKRIWPVIVSPGNVNTGFNETGNEIAENGEPELVAAHLHVVETIHSRHGIPPADVAAVIKKAVDARRPRFYNVVGSNARRAALAKRLLGHAGAAILLRRYFGLQ